MALPLILANVTTPILGLVDTAILGRMEEVHYFAGAAIGSLIVTQIYWLCGFLKMSVTGLSAQTKNAEPHMQIKVLIQGAALSLLLAFCILLLQQAIVQAGLFFSDVSAQIASSTQDYFFVRIWGAPAAMLNLVIVGWLVGQHKTKLVLILQVLINVINIAASLLFVYVFDWGVKGVAGATTCAEYMMLILGVYFIFKHYSGQSKLKLSVDKRHELTARLRRWLNYKSMQSLLSLNSNIFIRNLALQFVIAFIMLRGAHFGAEAVAVNAIILQFFTLIALGLDGVANGVEALIGEAKGDNNIAKIHQNFKIGLVWSSIFAILYALVFYFLDSPIVNLLSDHANIRSAMQSYSNIIVWLPIIAHWCFLMDGVFVGLSKGAAMRTSMLVSTCLVFIPFYLVFSEQGNMAMWIAMLAFLASRGITQGTYYYYWTYYKPQNFIQ